MSWVADFVSLFYPRICQACEGELVKGEEHLCIGCLSSLPYTGFEQQSPNTVEQSFWGRTEVAAGAALLYFRKDSKVQHIMHRIKYKGEKELATYIGRLSGRRLQKSNRFNGIDAIIPVPLHKAKQRKRGFNQSEYFAMGLAEKMEIPLLADVLLKTTATSSQTKKSRWQRWQNVEEIFTVKNAGKIEGRHILLVDDIVTTGATLEACARKLQQAARCRVSIYTMAATL